MRMLVRFRTEAAWAIFSQSLSRRLPVASLVFSISPSLAKSLVTSCSLDISRENTATVFSGDALATDSATFRAILVLPIPGRAARSSRSDLFRPLIFLSTAERPVDRPGGSAPAVSLANWSMTSSTTTPTWVIS